MRPAEPLQVGDVSIEEADLATASRDDVLAWMAYHRTLEAEAPSLPFEPSRMRLRNLPDSLVLRLFVARERDRSIAADGRAILTRAGRNRHICQAHVSVRPDRRRRGIGRALLDRITGVAEDEGRTLLVAWTSDRVPEGEVLARRAGALPAQRSYVNRLLLSTLDRGKVRAWIEQGPLRAREYSLVWVDGSYPDDTIERFLDLRRVAGTAPRDDLELEPTALTADEVRSLQDALTAAGIQRWSVAARHDPTGEMVGFTEISYHPAEPTTVRQGATAVRPSHRGLGLGKWLKAAMLERLLAERPGVEEVRTGNAASNAAMLAINRELAFEPYIAATAWQVQVERVREYLAGPAQTRRGPSAAAPSPAARTD